MLVSGELLSAVEIETAPGPRHAVVWLHGLGASGYDLLPVIPLLSLPALPPVRFVLPHAPRIPVTINSGLVMAAWFDIKLVRQARSHDEAGIRRSAARVSALIAREQVRGVAPERLILAGFSQGGAIALHVALRHPEPLAGLVALSTYLVLEDTLAAERAAANRGLPVFQAHGTLDPMVDVALGQRTRDRLRALGHEVAWREYTMRHEIRAEEAHDLGAWIAARFAGFRQEDTARRRFPPR